MRRQVAFADREAGGLPSEEPARAEIYTTEELVELPLLLTPEQAFELLQVGRTHGWRLLKSGVIPSVTLSPRCIRVPRPTLEQMIAARASAPRVIGDVATPSEPITLHLPPRKRTAAQPAAAPDLSATTTTTPQCSQREDGHVR
jgi:hypothetical protein